MTILNQTKSSLVTKLTIGPIEAHPPLVLPLKVRELQLEQSGSDTNCCGKIPTM